MRRRNAEWLRPWEATVPPGDTSAPRTFKALVRDLRRQAREYRALPFAVTVDDEFAGQVTVTNIVGGSAATPATSDRDFHMSHRSSFATHRLTCGPDRRRALMV